MSRVHACCWCHRETMGGIALGAPLTGDKYANASHGHCNDCGDDFEKGFTAETIIARARTRILNLASAPVASAGRQRQQQLIS